MMNTELCKQFSFEKYVESEYDLTSVDEMCGWLSANCNQVVFYGFVTRWASVEFKSPEDLSAFELKFGHILDKQRR